MPEQQDSLIANAKRRMKKEEGATEEIWKEMVYNKDITNEKVIDAYKVWAEAYDKDFAIVHPNRAEHMAVYLDELVTQFGMKKENLKILDVAAGTGLVGEELKKKGFNIKNITALDLCPDMLNVAKKKNVYGRLVQAPFGSTMPKGMTARSFDCVIMCGGFAAGHIPLSSLHTMARLCKEGGFIINSMTKQYADFVEEYKNIDKYVEELEDEGTWQIMFRRILSNYTKNNQGLVHGMRICKKETKGPVAGETNQIVVSGEDLVEQAKKRMSTEKGPTTEIWKEMVYDKNISNDKVNEAYKVWAEAYDKDFAMVHPDRAKHMADYLLELVEQAGMNKKDLTILDVAAGTGLVGEELKKAGFTVDKVTALDMCPDMLEVSRKKGVYGHLIQSPFGTTLPYGVKARSYDCVIMCGGFAAGHVPLASLHTMARICKKGGFLINSMTKQYADFVDEYKFIDQYIEELEEEGIWKIKFRRILEKYTKGNQGLVHAMRVL